MCIVSYVSYTFLLNGAPKGFLRPTRGIRQSDPLSSYLFLLCVEGLSFMLKKAEMKKKLTGVKVSRGSPIISHILFADDTLIFYKASKEEGTTIMHILEGYERALGQHVNIDKCSVSFEKRTSESQRKIVIKATKMKEVADQRKYLGLPSQIGRTKKEVFRYIRLRIEERTKGWKGKLLSQAGKKVLLKSIASTIT
ncbi:hypothetical protein LIER_40115 [Lithospermum erythrorhizon]|uniref:Reverse transcriptase domain-containing protein n=1 Tax=Lithospermum erythrorhizon TaxID=34254 RepID=A0AAV3QSP0_LITER